MKIELACIDKDTNNKKLAPYFFAAAGQKIDKLCLPVGLLNSMPELKDSVELIGLVDYPQGLNATKIRTHEIIHASRSGAKTVDLPINTVYINDVQYDKITADFRSCLKAANDVNVELRPVIEYQLFNTDTIIEVCDILANLGAKTIVNATGKMVGEFADNILVAQQIMTRTGVQVVIAGRLYTEKHIHLCRILEAESIRLYSVGVAENLLGKLY